MRVTVRLFAMLREQAGWRERDFELGAGATIDDAWSAVTDVAPNLAAHRAAVRFARNREYAAPDEPLSDGDELVLIPPVAGGADPYRRLEMTAAPISDALLAELRGIVPTSADGALVVFVDQTRDTPGTPAPGEVEEAARHVGQPVAALEYEAFEEMALDIFGAIAAEIEARFGVRRLAIIHRTGRVALGEPSVVIAAAAAHRAAAFDAARYAIEELKARSPIWKSEQYADGSIWIGSPPRSGPMEEGG